MDLGITITLVISKFLIRILLRMLKGLFRVWYCSYLGFETVVDVFEVASLLIENNNSSAQTLYLRLIQFKKPNRYQLIQSRLEISVVKLNVQLELPDHNIVKTLLSKDMQHECIVKHHGIQESFPNLIVSIKQRQIKYKRMEINVQRADLSIDQFVSIQCYLFFFRLR